jgi:biotin carboxyl carrier protein
MIYEVRIADKTYKVDLRKERDLWQCLLNGREFPLDVISTQAGVFSVLIGGQSFEVKQESIGAETNIIVGSQRFPIELRDPRSLRSRRNSNADLAGPRKVTAPMPGKVVRILVQAGTAVEQGQGVIVIEAMKMQNELKSPKRGVVRKLAISEGAAVEAGQVLVEVE